MKKINWNMKFILAGATIAVPAFMLVACGGKDLGSVVHAKPAAHIKTAEFWANSALFQAAMLAYNTLRWMAVCSGNKILQRWEAATIRTFLIRMAGKWTTGSRQQKLRVPIRMLYHAQWEAWVAVAET